MSPFAENPKSQSQGETLGLFSFLDNDATDDAPSGSLSAFIAERLKTRAESTPENVLEDVPLNLFNASPKASKPVESASSNKAKGPTGMVLRHLDSQLVNAHLEQYLPTASTRYYLMRERVMNELESLDSELTQLKKLNVPDDALKIAALEERVTFLREKLKGLDVTLSEMNPFQGMVYWVQKMSKVTPAPARNPRSLWAWIPNATRAMSDEMSQINTELQTLEHILSEQLHDPCFTPDQLVQLINRYDRYLKQTEQLVAKYHAKTGMHTRLNTALARWYRRWFEVGQ